MPITTVRLTLRLWVDHESFRRQHNCGDVRPGGQLKNNYSGIPQIIFNYDKINDAHASLNLKNRINTHTSCVKQYMKSSAISYSVLITDSKDTRKIYNFSPVVQTLADVLPYVKRGQAHIYVSTNLEAVSSNPQLEEMMDSLDC